MNSILMTTMSILRQLDQSLATLRLQAKEVGDNVLQNFYLNQDDYLYIQYKIVT